MQMPRTRAILIQINLLFSFLNAQEYTLATDTIQKLDEVIIKANTILGNKYVAKNRTGAYYYLSTEEFRDSG